MITNPALQQFYELYKGQALAEPDYTPQCVVVDKYWIRFNVGKPVAIHTGNAYEIWTKDTLSKWCIKIPLTSLKPGIRPGDMIVWDKYPGNEYGHTAIYCNSDGIFRDTIKVIEQDGSNPNTKVGIKDRHTKHILGAVRLKPEYDKNPRSIHNISQVNKPSVAPDVADTSQRAVKVASFACVAPIIHIAENIFNDPDIPGLQEALMDLHLAHPVFILALITGIGLLFAYQFALAQVQRGNHNKFYKWLVKAFGYAKKWEAEADPIMKDLFNV